VTGLGCRFPGHANDPEAFWRLLSNGVDAITEVPASRWPVDAYYSADPDAPGRTYTRHGGFIDRIDTFDPHFFGISPREARSIDPQHRLLLEVAWEALEHAGELPDRLSGTRTGVFVGITGNEYAQMLKVAGAQHLDAYHLTGCSPNFVAGRVSHLLGLQGPAMAVDTACSSALVGVHLACQSLRSGDCDLALAGGVNALLTPDQFITAAKARMLSADGRCKTFDARADGYGRGEGCGVVVLRRLSDAVSRGDRILAVIRASVVNQDGPSSGLTVPNKLAQEALIREALARAGVPPASVGYVEAHGTGTPLGDPIEVRALAAVLREGRPASSPFLLGSVKTNIGHLESAAGIAGLIKVILALYHEAIPAHLHLQTPTAHVDWSDVPARIPTALTPWPAGAQPRIAAVSSFGGSGTNAHLIVAEAPATPPATDAVERPAHVLSLSARTPAALDRFALAYADYFASEPEASVADVCFTANTGRSAFEHRLAVVGASAAEMREALTAAAAGRSHGRMTRGEVARGAAPKIAFLFTGQGAQFAGMGAALYETEPVFRAALDRCAGILDGVLERPLLSVMFRARPDDAALIDQTAYTQPALFALEWALAELWEAWGVTPAMMLGHSVGEYVAACRAGVFAVDDGLRLIAERARLMQAQPAGGSMAAVFADRDRVQAAVRPYAQTVAIAAVNGPENVVIAGAAGDVQAIRNALGDDGVRSLALAVSHAFHSPLMDPMLDGFERAAAGVAFTAPRIPFVSNVTGAPVAADVVVRPAYWRRHVREAVQFASGVEALHRAGCTVFVELGPSPTLLGLAARCLPDATVVHWSSLRKGQPDGAQMLRAAGGLWTLGGTVDWGAVDRGRARRRLLTPTYPFEQERCWVDPPAGAQHVASDRAVATPAGVHPLLARRVRVAGSEDVVFESELRADTPFVADHVVFDEPVFPATGYLEGIRAAAAAVLGRPVVIERVEIERALRLSPGVDALLQIAVRRQADGTAVCRISSAAPDADEWTLHATAAVRPASGTEDARRGVDEAARVSAARAACARAISADEHYETAASRGLVFGPRYRGIARLWVGAGQALAEIDVPAAAAADPASFVWHPAVLDACLQPLAALLMPAGAAEGVFVPVAIEHVWLAESAPEHLRTLVVLRDAGGAADAATADVTVTDLAGATVARIDGLRLQRVAHGRLAPGAEERPTDWVYRVEWQQVEGNAAATLRTLPAPADLGSDVRARVSLEAPEYGAPKYDAVLSRLNGISVAYMISALRELGWRPLAGARLTMPAFADQLSVAPQHRRFLGRILGILTEDRVGMLTEDRVLEADGDGWVVRGDVPAPNPEELIAALGDTSCCEADLTLMTRVGRNLAAALRGERKGVDLLFPGGSVADAERLYEQSPLFSAYNHAIEETISAIASRAAAGAPLRILEIGAGTGATTARVLPRLTGADVEYTFTDVSPLFLARARDKFRRFATVRYELLDIERAPLSQGFAAHRYDVVLAANVLHATKRLDDTLRHARTLLASGGLLVLLEGTQPLPLGDLIVGLTDGWWRFEDAPLRTAHALVPIAAWGPLLARTGFDGVEAIDSAISPTLAHHAVILARAAAAAGTRGSWLLLGGGSMADGLAAALQAQGRHVVTVRAGERYERIDARRYVVNPGAPGDMARVIRDACAAGDPPCEGIVHMFGAEVELDETNGTIGEAAVTVCGSALHLVRALDVVPASRMPRVWITTRGAQAVTSGELTNVAAATLWGFGATVVAERPELRCVRLDLDSVSAVEAVAAELVSPCAEDQIALRDGRRYVARLASLPIPADADAAPERLEIVRSGVLDGVEYRPLARRVPGPGEIEIAVEAAGLNFRDVLRVLGTYPDDSGEPLGVECAGRIVAVGQGVAPSRIGEQVVAIANGSFDTHTTTRSELAVARPSNLDAEQACTVPSAILTAQYALETLAGVRDGDRVLIHAATGGVGLAAVKIALSAGAEVFATAGSERKRGYLRELGVAHVFDSRSLDFVESVRAAASRGVDVVLNSLTGEFIPASLGLLAPNGRFIEIGRRDIWSAERVASLRPDVRYETVNLGALFRDEPGRVGGMLAAVLARVAEGGLEPLPVERFPASRVVDALRHMAQARHIGKIVITRGASTPMCAPDGSFLITGGLAGVGLRVAGWMVQMGARELILMGRRAPDDDAAAAVASLRRAGARVHVVAGDVSREADVKAALALVDRPLRGIMHCAGVLDDGVLSQQEWSRFAAVFAPKVTGTWLLHTLTRDLPLDFFVLFSSAVSVLGSAGQANHAAACAFQDALAWRRAAMGLPALAINWGPWSDIGSVVRQNVGDRLRTKGLVAMAPDQGVALLSALMRSDVPPQVAVLRADWTQLGSDARGQVAPFFARVARAPRVTAVRVERPEAPASVAEQWRRAPITERRKQIAAFIRQQIGAVLGLDPGFVIDPQLGLRDLGVDSLMSIELRNRLQTDVGQPLPSTLVFDFPTFAALTDFLSVQVCGPDAADTGDQTGTAADERADAVAALDQLSEDDAEALLLEELSRGERGQAV